MDSDSGRYRSGTASFHHHDPGSRSGYARHGFRCGSWQKQPLHTPFPSGYPVRAFNALGVELAGSVIQTGIFQTLADNFQLLKPFRHRITFTEDREVMLHTFLQCFTDRHRIFTVTVIVPAVQAIQRRFYIRLAGIAQCALLGDGFLQMQTCRTTKYDQSPAASCRPDG